MTTPYTQARKRRRKLGRYASGDPRWITAKRLGTCTHCLGLIEPGDKGFYFPNGAALYCEECGRKEARAFAEAVLG